MIQNLVCSTWTCWAVPFFFVVSGFFFASTRQFKYLSFLQKKCKTLLVPYIIWAIIGAAVQLITMIPNNLRMGYDRFANTILAHPTIIERVNALFGIANYPEIGNGLVGPYGDRPLWYIRTLLILFVFSPLFMFLRRYPKLLMLLNAVFIFVIPGYSLPYLCIRCGAIGYFMLGVLLFDYQDNIVISDICLIIGGLIGTVLSMIFAFHEPWLKYGERVFPFLISGAIWYLLRHCKNDLQKYDFINYSFWVYCLHIIFSGTLIGLGWWILGKNNANSMLLLVIVPVVVIFVSLFSAELVKRICPRIFALMTGGRG